MTAVAGGGDAGSAVNVGANVALIRQERRARVQADPHLHPAGAQPLDDLARRLECAGRCGKCEEERVPLGVDLGAAPLGA